jgi:hypothetical protein
MNSIFGNETLEEQEANQYRAGQRVELKSRPGVVAVIAEYDPMMVPSIWLEGDPKPRYPHELNLLAQPMMICWLNNFPKRAGAGHPGIKSRDRIATAS